MNERPARDGSWGLVILTMIFIGFAIWSGYQIRDLQELREEVRELKLQVDNHQVELSRFRVRSLDAGEQQQLP